jgi:Flp pilus assembly protein TadD
MLGDLETAERLGRGALATLEGRSPLVESETRSVLGQVAARQDRTDDAQVELQCAAALLTGIGADRSVAELWYELGACLDDLGLVSEARDAFRRAAAATGIQLHPGTRSGVGTSSLSRG